MFGEEKGEVTMGLYISFDLYHKDQAQPYVSEDGREVLKAVDFEHGCLVMRISD